MANPFGLPKVLLAEREARRRKQFRAGVYATLITATILIMGMLIQGCRTSKHRQRERPFNRLSGQISGRRDRRQIHCQRQWRRRKQRRKQIG